MKLDLIGFLVYPLLLGISLGQVLVTGPPSSKPTYRDLQELNATCSNGFIDFCDSRSRDFGSQKTMTCACDNQCLIYNDCCVNATPKPPPTPSAFDFEPNKQFVCQHFVNFGHFYVLNRCPSSWTGPQAVVDSCEKPISNQTLKDPLMTMPVTNTVAGTTYSNYFCAVCNYENASSITVWPPLLEFDNNLKSLNLTYQNITGDYVKDHLVYNEEENSWGLYLWGSTDVPKLHFYDAKIYPSMPMGLEEKLRHCKPDLISSCPNNWTDVTVANNCAAFQGALYLSEGENGTGYRNAYCGICNGQSTNRLICNTPKAKTYDFTMRAFSHDAFSVLLDISGSRGTRVGNTTPKCKSGEVYNPFKKTCQRLLCGFSWMVLVNKKCVNINSLKATSRATWSTVPRTEPVTVRSTSISSTRLSLTTEPATTVNNLGSDPNSTMEGSTVSLLLEVTTGSVSEVTTGSVPEVTTGSVPEVTTGSFSEGESTTKSVFVIGTDMTTIPFEPVDVLSESADVTSESPLTIGYEVNEYHNSTYSEMIPLTENYTEIEYRGMNTPHIAEVPQDLDYEKSTESASDGTGIEYSVEFIDCGKLSVDPPNYKLLENGSLTIPRFNKIYDVKNYIIMDDAALICAESLNQNESQQASKFSPPMGYVTVTGLSISIFCLVLHLILYFILPDMRNLSTNNLASLSLTLLLAYVSFIVRQISTLSKVACIVVASCTYFFFLSSFFWMSAMSFDVWRTLKVATQELRVTTGRQYKRFFLYCLYSWGMPALSLTAVLLVDNSPNVPQEFRPEFGTESCWFAQRNALLVFFAAPLIVIMVTNIVLFISSARMILSTTNSTSKNHSCTTNSRRNFKLYLRLAIMMGLTWTVGLIAGYLNNEVMWYVFIILNTLQGLFIFVGFSCNKKVKKNLSDKVEAFTRRHAYRTSSLNSGSGFHTNSTFPSNVSVKTSSSSTGDSRVMVNSPISPKAVFRPPVTSFKQLQDGMETLY